MHMTIGRKLMCAFGLIIGLMLLSGGISMYVLRSMQDSIENVVDISFPSMRAADRAFTGLNGALASLRGYIILGDDPQKARQFQESHRQAWQSIHAAIDRFSVRREFWPAEDQRRFDELARKTRDLETLHAQIIGAAHGSGMVDAQQLLDDAASVSQAAAVEADLNAITASIERRMLDRRSQLDDDLRSLAVTGISTSLVAALIAIVVAALLSRQITNSVQTLVGRANDIAAGNLKSGELDVTSRDEIGQLSENFNRMQSSLRELTSQIHSVTENVNSAATQISSSTQQQASSTKEQAATVQQITSTMQEISQTGAQIIEKARELSASAEAAATASNAGMDAVRDTSRTMEEIREQVEDVAEHIVALSEKTQAIGDIVATVNEVAEQSNLLALNATIEAVAAGEQGSRFSVVAGEMKNLADQAKQCTIQVRDILGEIQKGINSSVMLTEEAVKRVESGKKRSQLTETAIRQMSDTTEQSVQAFQQIIGATNQQQIGFEQVTQGMEDIRVAAQQTASGTSQLEQAVLNLTSLSRQLKTAVGSYQI